MQNTYQALMLGLRDYVNKNRFPGVLLGLSGGIDSALTAALAVDALGPDKVRAVMMPSPYTSQESLDDAPKEGASRQVADRQPSVEQRMLRDVRLREVREAIEMLPGKQRAAVLMHKYEELDYSEIAKIMSCSESALKSLLFRAYESLRVELAPLVVRHGTSST